MDHKEPEPLAEKKRYQDAPTAALPLRDAHVTDLDLLLFRERYLPAAVAPEILAEAMRNLGYVQNFGVGIQIAREAMARNGNPPIEFRVDSRTVVTTLRRAEKRGG